MYVTWERIVSAEPQLLLQGVTRGRVYAESTDLTEEKSLLAKTFGCAFHTLQSEINSAINTQGIIGGSGADRARTTSASQSQFMENRATTSPWL